MVQQYFQNLIWEGICDYYEVLINVDALDYPEHDYHAQPVGQQSGLSEGCLEEFQAYYLEKNEFGRKKKRKTYILC